MVYDVTMLKAFYASYKGKMEHVRAILQRPLTLAEKILYTHLFDEKGVKDYKRGEDYVNFRPDRVAMQDATAQMALLQFMNAGREQVAVPSTVHCDHLIQAYRGAREDIATATKTNEEVYDFCVTFLPDTVSASGNRVRVSFIRWYWKIMPSLVE